MLLALFLGAVAGRGAQKWYDATVLGVRGRAFNDTENFFERLPASAKSVVRDEVFSLSTMPAGLFLQFETDASRVFINYTLTSRSTSMWHFPDTGVAGVDAYSWDEANATWRWTGTVAPMFPITTGLLAAVSCANGGAKCTPRVYRVHLPTYADVRAVSIGINAEAKLLRADSSHLSPTKKPIVWYGTSILQGAVASRPGQVNTHIVSRALETEVFNFGFSGNGVMELSVAQYIATIDASVFIIDCNPNMDAPTITSRAAPLVAYLRAHGHAATPIVLSEGTVYGSDWTGANGNAPKNAALTAAYNAMKAAGDAHIYYARGVDIFSSDLGLSAVNGMWVDPTVGGTHLTDLGMRMQAAFWAKKIPAVLAASRAAAMRAATTARAATHAPAAALPSRATLAAEAVTSAALVARLDAAADAQRAAPSPRALGDAVDARAFTLGRPFPGTTRNHSYDRFPGRYASELSTAVWELSEMSTGSYLRFTADSTVQFNWTLRSVCVEKWFAGCHLADMPLSATNAFDVYAYDPLSAKWRHLPSDLQHYAESGSAAIYRPSVMETGNVTFLVYLPLRNAPATITITPLSRGAYLCGGAKAACAEGDQAPDFVLPPIVWYGGANQQGGAAARPGSAYDAVIARALRREVWNLGFAANGTMEASVGTLVGEISAAAAIVIDCLPDMSAAEISARTAPLVAQIRAQPHHAATPIVLAEGTPTPGEWLNNSATRTWGNSRNAALRAVYEQLLASGDENLTYVFAKDLFVYSGGRSLTPGAEGREVNPTVDGVEASDLGQYEIAEFYVALFKKLIAR